MSDSYINYLDSVSLALLVKHFGGQELYIPEKKQGKSWERLVAVLGEDRAGSAVRWLQGEKLPIPTRVGERRRETIKRLYLEGKTVTEISEMVFVDRVSVRSIYRILKESA